VDLEVPRSSRGGGTITKSTTYTDGDDLIFGSLFSGVCIRVTTDWAYGALAIGAMILAAETGLSQSPSLIQKLPQFLRHPFWGLAPLVLVLIATSILGARAAGLIGAERPSSAAIVNTPAPDRSKVFLQLWGILKPFTYQVTVDASQLEQFKEEYHLILVVRRSFFDRMTDESIETSNLYTIESSLMTLAHASSNKLAHASYNKLRFLIEDPAVIEYDVVVLPKMVTEKEITKLNSIYNLGRKIISSASQVVSQSNQVTKAPFCSLINC
jgi:hypothetical protein